jgi:hypothetical protein
VIFSEKSLDITASLDILGGATATFDCDPAGGTFQFIGVSAQSSELPTTTTVSVPPTVGPAGDTTTTVAGAATGGSTTLPRTGGSVLLGLALAAMLIDLGVVAVMAARRRAGVLYDR